MKTIAIAAILLAATAMAPAPPQPRAVMIGLDGPDADACHAIGEVSGLNRRGDNYLSVRAAPTARARELARLGPGRRVHLCDATDDGRWAGIVYGRDARQDCGISSPVSRPQPYQAAWACRSGWVAARYITTIAG